MSLNGPFADIGDLVGGSAPFPTADIVADIRAQIDEGAPSLISCYGSNGPMA
jgi:hypothetical protein